MVEKRRAAMASGAPLREGAVVFVSYSRGDAEWQRKFVDMLKPVVRERRLEVWSDERNLVGEQWRPQLVEAIRRSRAALLLVSRDFLASDFIMQQEVPALIEHGVRLVYVLVRPCLWDEVGILERVQWAHDPIRDGPVATSSDPEGQIVRVCKKLLELLPPEAAGELPGATFGVGGIAVPSACQAEAVGPEEQPGRLYDVPSLPPTFVAREELAGLRDAVLRRGHGAVGITGKALGLYGQGGIGKTVLAAALARDEAVRRHFPDGLFWVTVGERGNLVAVQIALLARLGVAHQELRSASQGLALLREALAERQCLLIVDDVWSTAAAAAFRVVGPRGRVLYTTRDATVLHEIGADVERVDVLPPYAARQLLARLTDTRVEALPAESNRILQATGGVVLALALVGGVVRGGRRTWRDVADELEQSSDTFLDHPYANTFKAMQVGVTALNRALAEAYRSLAVYPEDTLVPVTAVARYWRHLWGASPEETHAQLEVLSARKLLSVDGEAIAFHDLQRYFLLLQASDLSVLHADLLGAYRALLPHGSDAWRELPRHEPYIWEHLLYHLRGTGDAVGVRALATDLAYLALRSFAAGPWAAESDLREAAELYPDHVAIAWLLSIFTQWGHLFIDHPTIGDLAATLASRTHDPPAPLNSEALSVLLPPRHLVARWGLPSAPPALIRILEGHTKEVWTLVFSADGGRLASAGADATVCVWDSASGQLTATLEGHSKRVWAVAFSPDGHQLASAGGDVTVRLWESATGQLTTTLEGHSAQVRAVAFSPDGRQLASASSDRKLYVWDSHGGHLTATLKGHFRRVWAVAFSPDGRQLASASDDRTVRVWDPASGELTATLEGHIGPVHAVAFSPDGRQLASASDDHTIRVWDPASGELTATLEGHIGPVHAVAFSPDGRQVASASGDATVRVWDPASGQLTATLGGHSRRVQSVAFSPNGGQLASAGDDGKIRVWDPHSRTLTATLAGHTGPVRAVAFSPDGRQLASAGADGRVRVWHPASGRLSAGLAGHSRAVRAVASSPDGRQLASGGADARVRVWDPASGRVTATLEGHSRPVRAIAFSPDGRQLASASEDHTVRVWDPACGQLTATLEGHSRAVRAIAFSPDGRQLASASDDYTVRMWDPACGQLTATLEDHRRPVQAVGFSPDGRQLASASDDHTVRVWDPGRGRLTAILTGHASWIGAVAFSPDGRQLASASDDQTVRIWDPASGQLTATLDGHSRPVRAIAFSPDGRQLASASNDHTVRVWDPSAGRLTATLEGHSSRVWAVAFSPDGGQLASASDDETVRVWDPYGAAAICLLRLGANVTALLWAPCGITVAADTSVIQLELTDGGTGKNQDLR